MSATFVYAALLVGVVLLVALYALLVPPRPAARDGEELGTEKEKDKGTAGHCGSTPSPSSDPAPLPPARSGSGSVGARSRRARKEE